MSSKQCDSAGVLQDDRSLKTALLASMSSTATVFNWFHELRTCRQCLDDQHKSGCPATALTLNMITKARTIIKPKIQEACACAAFDNNNQVPRRGLCSSRADSNTRCIVHSACLSGASTISTTYLATRERSNVDHLLSIVSI